MNNSDRSLILILIEAHRVHAWQGEIFTLLLGILLWLI